MPPPTPPVIVTTDLDGPQPPEQASNNNLNTPSATAQHRRQVSDPSRLSPLTAQNPGFVAPPSTVVTPAASSSQASSPTDAATLAPIGEKDIANGANIDHYRSESVGTWASTGTTEKPAASNLAPTDTIKDELENEPKPKWRLFGRKKKAEEGPVTQMNPDDDTTDVTPFRENPTRLAFLVDPKSIENLTKIGGIDGVLGGLGVDPTKGIRTGHDGGAPRSSADMPGGNEAQWHATIADRQRAYGKNELPDRPSKTLFELMWIAFKDKVLILLMIAAVISLALGLWQDLGQKHDLIITDDCPQGCEPPKVEWIEGVAILIAVLIVVLVGSLNDWQKEKQFKKLSDKRDDRTVKVIRDGSEQVINVRDLVVGDVALLEPGEVVPVDGIYLRGHNVLCDESGATGESDAIKKATYAECIAEREKGRAKLDCFIISGAKVLEGVGEYVVTSVGVHSFNGRIMMSMRTGDESTPLQTKLNNLAELIAKCGATAGIVLFSALMIRFFVQLKEPGLTKDDKVNAFIKNLIISVTIIVVAVPEGLPLAVTLALAFATKRMTKQNLLVRVLGSCETMGHATVICTDKTGTLTQNVMTVVAGSLGVHGKFVRNLKDNAERSIGDAEGHDRADFAFDLDQMNNYASPELQTLFNDAIVINSTAFESTPEDGGPTEFVGSKTETALLRMAQQLGWANYKQVRSENKVVQMIPFSSELKAMGVVIKHGDKYRLFVKGASEVLTAKCTNYVVVTDPAAPGVSVAAYDEAAQQNISKTIVFYANQSLRTLALAFRDFEQWPPVGAEEFSAEEVPFKLISQDLNLISIVGIEDPLRDGVPEAVKDCQDAGVAVKMCTGDNVITAKSIARQCGMFTPGGIIMEGPDFRALSDADRLAIVPRLQVLARSSPQDKQLLVHTLKTGLHEVVGVTGDGTNDGPALKLANVGFAMGIAGTEVAKEASDIILMDDSFSNIVLAIMWGRCVNDSVKKFLQFQISVNITAVVITFVSAVASKEMKSVLTAVQLLWVNLIMDTFAALALATDPATRQSLKRKPDSRYAPLITVDMWKMIVIQASYQIIVCLVLHFVGKRILGMEQSIHNDAELRTLVFNCFVFCQIFNQLNCRRLDRRFNIFEGFFRNYWFMAIFLIMVGGQCLIIEVGGVAFSVQRLEGRDWGISIIVGFISIPIGALVRILPTKPFERMLVKMRLYPDPDALPVYVPEEDEDDGKDDYKYNPTLDTVKDNLATYSSLRGGRLNATNILRGSRHRKLRKADITLPGLLTMVPTLVGGSVGAGASWVSAVNAKGLSDPAAQEATRSNTELARQHIQLHPDTDPSDPLYEKFGLTPPSPARQ